MGGRGGKARLQGDRVAWVSVLVIMFLVCFNFYTPFHSVLMLVKRKHTEELDQHCNVIITIVTKIHERARGKIGNSCSSCVSLPS